MTQVYCCCMVPTFRSFIPPLSTTWRWMQHGHPKRWYPATTLRGFTTQKTSTRNITAVKASKFVNGSHNRGSSVNIVTRLQAGGLIFNSQQGQWRDVFSSSPHTDRLWGPANLLISGDRGLYRRGYRGRSVKLTTHLHLVQRLRMPPPPNTSSRRGT
jgi:hypothetical protein